MAKNQNVFIRRKGPFKKEREHRIDNEIDHFEVRVVGEGIQTGVIPTHEALKIAQDQGVQLVQITEAKDNNPPVCRIVEYNKFLYELKMKKKKQQNAGSKSVLKTIKISQHIGDHDMNVKAKQANQFLKDNNKVRVELQFKGREIVYKDHGKLALLRMAQMVEEVGKVESLPEMENKKMFIMITPKKK